MLKISVPVLWDEDNNFLNGSPYSIDAKSVYVGTVQKPTAIFPPNAIPTLQSCLQINDPDLGTLYVDLTFAQYYALMADVVTPVGKNMYRLEFTVGDPGFPAETTQIQTDTLIGATVTAISIGGVNISFLGVDFENTTSEGRITFLDILILGDIYVISYYK